MILPTDRAASQITIWFYWETNKPQQFMKNNNIEKRETQAADDVLIYINHHPMAHVRFLIHPTFPKLHSLAVTLYH